MIGIAVTLCALLIAGLFIASWRIGARRVLSFLEDRKARFATSAVLFIGFTVLLAGTIAFNGYLRESHDIDDAISASSKHFIHGGNPYSDPVVPRFKEVWHEGVAMTNGTLNYLPLTLFAYSGAYLVLGFIGPAWYQLVNVLFGVLAGVVLSRTFPKAPRWILYPTVGIVSLIFAFDNIMLTFLLFSIFLYYSLGSKSRFGTFLALWALFLAFSVKMAGMMSLGAYGLFLVQRYRFKDRDVNVQMAVFAALALSACLLSIGLFGLGDLMDSTFLFMSDPSVRANGAYFGGTVLSEVLGGSPAFTLVSYGILIAALASTMLVRGLVGRLFLAEAVLPFVAVKDSQALLVIPFLLLMAALWSAGDPDPEKG